MVSVCLTTAAQHGSKSIAFPALGTGNLGYPRDMVAAAMFDEVKKFSMANQRTSLQDVCFLVYPADRATVQVKIYFSILFRSSSSAFYFLDLLFLSSCSLCAY